MTDDLQLFIMEVPVTFSKVMKLSPVRNSQA